MPRPESARRALRIKGPDAFVDAAHNATLVWPSGGADEVGTLRLSIDRAWDEIDRNGDAAGRDFWISEVDDDGATALVLEGLPVSPITLVTSEDAPEGVLASYADRASNRESVARILRALLPASALSLHG